MEIIEVKKYSNDVLEGINKLLPQLSSAAKPLDEPDLKQIIESETTRLLVAIEEGQFSGSLTLVIFKIPTGTRMWIEDVVVDYSKRGQGIGKMLTEHAINLAKKLNKQF